MRGIFLISFLSGCIAVSTYQTPVTTPKDDISFGFSLSGFFSPDTLYELPPITVPTFSFRYGLSDNSDIGFSFVGFPFFFGTNYVDYKYQITNTGLLSAIDIGSGFWVWFGDFFDVRNPYFVLPFVGLSFGNERVFFGGRINYATYSQYTRYRENNQDVWKRESTSFAFTSLFLGFTLGKGSFKFAPEFDFIIPISQIQTLKDQAFLPALGFSYTFGFIYLPSK
ncbi:MAG: hypothetical protein ABIL49_02295 [candidate division WOR-3 bacterium]|jgi:hypothetical protein